MEFPYLRFRRIKREIHFKFEYIRWALEYVVHTYLSLKIGGLLLTRWLRSGKGIKISFLVPSKICTIWSLYSYTYVGAKSCNRNTNAAPGGLILAGGTPIRYLQTARIYWPIVLPAEQRFSKRPRASRASIQNLPNPLRRGRRSACTAIAVCNPAGDQQPNSKPSDIPVNGFLSVPKSKARPLIVIFILNL